MVDTIFLDKLKIILADENLELYMYLLNRLPWYFTISFTCKLCIYGICSALRPPVYWSFSEEIVSLKSVIIIFFMITAKVNMLSLTEVYDEDI